MEKIVLKSTHPEEYPDLEVECKIIPNDQIGAYLKTIPVSNKVLVRRTKVLDLEYSKEGTIFKETLKTNYAGKEYLLTQSQKTIKLRNGNLDCIAARAFSLDEKFVINRKTIADHYSEVEHPTEGYLYTPEFCSLTATKTNQNVIIITATGEPEVCLVGSYIITNDEDTNDYSVIEKDRFESSYSIISSQPKEKNVEKPKSKVKQFIKKITKKDIE